MDQGEVKMNYDEATGLVEISVRAPLRIDFVSAKVGITAILELAATATLMSLKRQREVLAAAAGGRPT